MNRTAALVVGIGLILVGIFCVFNGPPKDGRATQMATGFLGLLLVLVGISLAFSRTIVNKIGFGKDKYIEFARQDSEPPVKVIPAEEKAKRIQYAQHNPPPAVKAPKFNALTDAPDIGTFPSSDPMIPMYILDTNYRILDWNQAFSIAFDRSMEGRRGQSALEWVYLLDNFKDVLNHARQRFSDPDNLPRFDKEELRYTSVRYGPIVATKRAYQIPDDSDDYAGWLVILDTQIVNPEKARQFNFELIRRLSQTLLWTEYSLSYDELLTNVSPYEELIRRLLGEEGDLPPVAEGCRVLDLGAGTGNIARRLAAAGRLVLALDNNPAMLNILRGKCSGLLLRDDSGPGVMAVNQDINSLFGVPDDYFDVAIANNVLYSLSDPGPCINEVCRVLKPGGEFRLSGPAKGVRLDKLFKRFRAELIQRKAFDRMLEHFERAQRLNFVLERELQRWAAFDIDAALQAAGFPGVLQEESFYLGNGKMVLTKKPPV